MIDELAKAIYALIPDGAYLKRMTTDPSRPYETYFQPDPWEEVRAERQQEIRDIALAVLRHLREPTPEMIEAGIEPSDAWEDDVRKIFTAMIDAAIGETNE